MHKNSKQILTALVEIYHHGALDTFFAGMPQEEIKELEKYRQSNLDVSQVAIDPKVIFDGRIHYSWIAETLKTFDPNLQSLMIAALPDPIGNSLGTIQQIERAAEPYPPMSKYLLRLLAEKMSLTDILPEAFLPEESLTFLIKNTKSELINIINFLGIYDLAEEVKTIVNKTLLKSVYSGLTAPQQKFLRNCLHQRQRFTPAKMGLGNWQGDPLELQRVLHRRGIVRLGYALSGQHPDLLWYISRRLDIGRGKLLEKSYSAKEISSVTITLQQQISAIINFLKKQDSP